MVDQKIHYDCSKCRHFIKVKFVDGDINANIETHTCVKLSAHEDCDYKEKIT